MATPSDRGLLIAARALLDTPEKWWRGSNHTGVEDNCRCPITAINDPWVMRLCRLFAAAAGLADDVQEIADWHDDPARTHAEVLAAFDRAIAGAS